MRDKFKQVSEKGAFLLMVSTKLGLKYETVRMWFHNSKKEIPEKYHDFINNALDLQIEADIKIKEIKVSVYEML